MRCCLECRLGKRMAHMHVVISRLRGGSVALHILFSLQHPDHDISLQAHRFKMLTCVCHVYLSCVFLYLLFGVAFVCAGIASTLRSEMGHSVSKPGNGPRQTPSSALQSRCIKVQPKSLLLEICVCYDNPSIVKLCHSDFCVLLHIGLKLIYNVIIYRETKRFDVFKLSNVL